MDKKEYIHTFDVLLKRKKPETTTTVNEAGEKVTVTKEIEVEVPVEVLIKNPSRALKEEGDLFYASVFSNCLRRGIFSEAMLAKQFKDIGTTLSEDEKKKYKELIARYTELENEIQRCSLKGLDEEKKQYVVEQNEIRDALVDFRASQNALFSNTADTIARNKTILWYILALIHYKDEASGKILPLFPGQTFEDKSSIYDKMDGGDNEIFNACMEEASSFVTYWYLGLVKDTETYNDLKKKV